MFIAALFTVRRVVFAGLFTRHCDGKSLERHAWNGVSEELWRSFHDSFILNLGSRMFSLRISSGIDRVSVQSWKIDGDDVPQNRESNFLFHF